MPAFKYVYTDKDIEDVSLYISKAFNQQRSEKVSKLLAESDVISKPDEEKMLKIGEDV